MSHRVLAPIAFTASVLAASPARAESDAPAEAPSTRWHASLECDPAPFFLGGFGCVASVRPRATSWKLGVALYSLTYPDLLISGENDGFSVDIHPSFNVMIEYLLNRHARGGWFVGATVRQARTTYGLDDTAMTTDSTGYSVGVTGGYIWFPTRTGLYLQLWGSLSRTVYETREPTVGTRTFDALPISPYLAVHVGFEI